MKYLVSAIFLLVLFPACSKMNSDKNNQDTASFNLVSETDHATNTNGSTAQLLQRMEAAESRVKNSSTWMARKNLLAVDAKGNQKEARSTNVPKDEILSKHWSTKDPVTDHVEGTRTDKAYAELNLPAAAAPIIVAVVDSGVDIHHEDLQGQIWTNTRELNGRAGIDDDGNGYIDDINGWNFLGNSAGINVVHTTMELTREFRRLSWGSHQAQTPQEILELETITKLFTTERSDAASKYQKTLQILQDFNIASDILKRAGVENQSLEALKQFQTTNELFLRAKGYLVSMIENGRTRESIQAYLREESIALDYYYNPYFDSSRTVLDEPDDLQERSYGNNDVLGDDGEHGTHVSGSIAAVRSNAKGIDGQADAVKIMSIRVVPDGDERDKDVANGIRYAVDNGARVINMSFGKAYSPHRTIVRDAMVYAAEHNVLVVHSAGNSSLNLDLTENVSYPVRSGNTWLEVGASAAQNGNTMAASFSNYGHSTVDLFAPGYGVASTVPRNEYAVMSGTSMAAPQISGIAALIMSRYPSLSAVKVKELIIGNVRQYPDLQVYYPISRAARKNGGTPTLGFFKDLSITGGVVDTFTALQAAAAAVLVPQTPRAEIAGQ